MEQTISGLRVIISNHETTIRGLEGKKLELEEYVEERNDVVRQRDECLAREKENIVARDNLQKELENATDYILELEEKVYKANKTSLELLK